MSQEPPKNNAAWIIVALISLIGTVVTAVIGANSNYKIEQLRANSEMTRIALAAIVTQAGATQQVMAATINAPTPTPVPTVIVQELINPTFTATAEAVTEPPTAAGDGLTEGTWTGTISQGSATNELVILVEKVDAPHFYGKIRLPTLNNSILEMEGTILISDEINDFVEQSKWSYVDGFDAKKPQTWLSFHYTSLIQGHNIIMTATFKALLEDNTIRGAWFYSPQDSEPDGYLTAFRAAP